MSETIQQVSAGEAQATIQPEVKKQAQNEEAKGQPPGEYWLDEEGNLQGVFDEWGKAVEEEASGEEPEKAVKEEAKQEKTEPEKAEPQKEEPRYYTPEEVARLELHEIDPTRLPPELRPYYEALLKEQAVAQDVPEPQIPDPRKEIETIYNVAKQRVEVLLGEKFDELNPKHIAALSLEVGKISQEVARQKAVQQKYFELRKSEPYFDQIDAYARQKLETLPYREAKRIEQAILAGNFDVLFSFWESCRREFYQKLEASKQPQAQAQSQTKPEPTPVEEPGKGEVEQKKRFDVRKLAYMNDDEQAQALIELGLV